MIILKEEKEKYTFHSVTKPVLEDDQWFPKNPAKKPTKWSIVIALLDELAIVILLGVIVYFVLI